MRRWKSDSPIVLGARESRVHGEAAGQVECWSGETFPAHTEVRKRMSTQLDQIAKKAKSDPKLRFTSLAHLLTPEFLKETWRQMNRRGRAASMGKRRRSLRVSWTHEFKRSVRGLKPAPIGLHRFAGWTYRRDLARPVRGRSEFRRSKTACFRRRSRGYSKRCSRRTSWTARMDFGRGVVPTTPYGRYASRSSRRRCSHVFEADIPAKPRQSAARRGAWRRLT